MFGRLKRKRDEEEAPLVPHGFLWQATDESGNPDEDQEELAKPATFEDNQSTSEEVAMPANATPQPESAPPRKLGAISPPLQWPSPNIQEIARHPEPRPIPYATQLANEPQQKRIEPAILETFVAKAMVKDVNPAPTRPKIAAVVRERTTAWSHAVSASVRSAMSYCGSFARAVSSGTLNAFASVRTELHHRAERVNIKGRIANVRNLAATKLSDLHQRSRGISATAGNKLGALQQATALRSRAGLNKSAENLRTIDFSWLARSFQRVRNLKVTVRIPRRDSARMTAAVSAVSMPWNRVRQSMNRDSRLWISMGMAAMSALLALGVVSGLSRYQPGKSPSVVAAHSPDPATGVPHFSANLADVGANGAAGVAPIAPTMQKAVDSSTAQRPSPAVPKQAAATPEPTKLVTLKSSTLPLTKVMTPQRPKRKAHFSEDDDYVAKDTYVVYGRNGKRSR